MSEANPPTQSEVESDADESSSGLSPREITDIIGRDATDLETSLLERYFEQVHPNLIRRGWKTAPAKTVEWNKTEQTMLNHVLNGVFFIDRLNRVLDDTILDPSDARTLIGLWVAHDYHKVNPENSKNWAGDDEFQTVYLDHVDDFATDVGLYEFDESLTAEQIHGIIVSHHSSDGACKESTTLDSHDYSQLLRMVDAIASTSDPTNLRDADGGPATRLRTALGEPFNYHVHTISDDRPLLTNVINDAISTVLQQTTDVDLLAIYDTGCAYLSDDVTDAIDVTPDLADAIYEETLTRLQRTHPAFSNPATLSEAFPLINNVGQKKHYKVRPRDFFYADTADVVRAIIQRGVSDGRNPADASAEIREHIAELDALTDIEFTHPRRLDGLSRAIMTIYKSIIRPLVQSDKADDTWMDTALDHLLAAFNVSDDVKTEIRRLTDEHPSLKEPKASFRIKYLIAQDIQNRCYDGTRDAETLANDLADDAIAALQTLDGWASLKTDKIGNVHDELRAYLIENVTIDGTPLRRVVGDSDDGYHRYAQPLDNDCVLCGEQTTASDSESLQLLKHIPELDVTLHDESTDEIAWTSRRNSCCYRCQLDLSLRVDETNIDHEDSNRLYVTAMPDYFYTPLSWALFNGVLDAYLGVNTYDSVALAKRVFANDGARGFDDWHTATVGAEDTRDLVNHLDYGFTPASGFGGHAISRPRHGDPGRDVFATLIASLYAGIRVHISPSPLDSPAATDFREMVQVSPQFTAFTDLFGDTVSLTEMNETLDALAASIILVDAAEKQEPPLTTLRKTLTNKRLPGAYFLRELERVDDAYPLPQFVEYAQFLDDQVTAYANSGEWVFDVDLDLSSEPLDRTQLRVTGAALAATLPPLLDEPTDSTSLTTLIDAAATGVADTEEFETHGVQAAANAARTISDGPSSSTITTDGAARAFGAVFLSEAVTELYANSVRRMTATTTALTTATYAALLDRTHTPDTDTNTTEDA